MRVLLVEPYFDGSHRAWAEGYRDHSRHDVALVTHPGSFWRWRMRGGALTLAEGVREAAGRGVDAVVVSDMVHAAALVGLCRGVLADAPLVVYFHENQLTYPLSPGQARDDSLALTNWLSMAVADEIWFNSSFHLDDVRAALPILLDSFPDQHHTARVEDVLERARVMPVGIDVAGRADSPRSTVDGPPVVLWNQRWEYDKDLPRFLAAVDRLARSGRDFRLVVAGQKPRLQDARFEATFARHEDRLLHVGEADEHRYRDLLRRADVVVSTARHEFFGVAVAEAIGAGAAPVLPDALAYPELVGPVVGHRCLYRDDAGLDERLARFVDDPDARLEVAGHLVPRLHRLFAWPVVAARYDDRLEELTGARRISPSPRYPPSR